MSQKEEDGYKRIILLTTMPLSLVWESVAIMSSLAPLTTLSKYSISSLSILLLSLLFHSLNCVDKKVNLRAGRCVGSLNGHSGVVMCVQFDDVINDNNDGGSPRTLNSSSNSNVTLPYIISGSRDTTVRVWDVRTLRPVHTLTDHSDWVRRVHFDSERIVSGSYDCTVKVCFFIIPFVIVMFNLWNRFGILIPENAHVHYLDM